MPYSYQNYGYQQQRPMQQQYQMPVQQAQQPMQYEYPLQYVGNGTLKEAEGYIIFPNQKGIFFDKANGMVYEKITYNDGQSFISEYKKVENETDKQAVEIAKEEKPLEVREFAKKTDLKDFITVEQYKELKEMFDGLQEQINGLKQSSKKTIKEQEKGE
jgi:hypothetical protein